MLAREDLSAARDQLIQLLSSFQGTRTGILILVFDAYQVKIIPAQFRSCITCTSSTQKTSQTADSYIEKPRISSPTSLRLPSQLPMGWNR